MEIEFTNGSFIKVLEHSKEGVIRGMRSEEIDNFEFGHESPREVIVGAGTKHEAVKFLDKQGNVQAEIPTHQGLLNAIVGYEHDPQTHSYNRDERRRIIKAAKEIERKYKKK